MEDVRYNEYTGSFLPSCSFNIADDGSNLFEKKHRTNSMLRTRLEFRSAKFDWSPSWKPCITSDPLTIITEIEFSSFPRFVAALDRKLSRSYL